jgi:hypothetical protein
VRLGGVRVEVRQVRARNLEDEKKSVEQRVVTYSSEPCFRFLESHQCCCFFLNATVVRAQTMFVRFTGTNNLRSDLFYGILLYSTIIYLRQKP